VVFGIEMEAKAYFFAEGLGCMHPYFKNLPLDGTKESYLLRRQSSILTLL
jgi:hypothetical protein